MYVSSAQHSTSIVRREDETMQFERRCPRMEWPGNPATKTGQQYDVDDGLGPRRARRSINPDLVVCKLSSSRTLSYIWDEVHLTALRLLSVRYIIESFRDVLRQSMSQV